MKGFMTFLWETDKLPHSPWRRPQQPNARRIVARALLTIALVALFAASSLAWHASSAKAQSASSLQHLATSSQTSSISQQDALTSAPWGWISDPSQREWFSGDFNGDGKTDLAYLWDDYGTVEIYTAFSNGDGTFSTASFQPAFGSSVWGWISDAGQHQWFTGDFNNDGKTDLVYLWNYNGYVEAYSAFSNGDGSFNVNGSPLSFGSESWGWIADASIHQWLTGDFNGDGQTDLAYLWDDNGYVETYSAFSNGDGTFATASAQPAFGSSRWGWISDPSLHQWLTGDFNGDGKTDLAYLWDDRGDVEAYTAFSNSDGSFTIAGDAVPNQGQYLYWEFNTSQAWATGDVDGNGKADIIQIYYSGLIGDGSRKVVTNDILSQGDGSFSSYNHYATYDGNANLGEQLITWDPDHVFLWGDFNGDHIPDFVYLGPDLYYKVLAYSEFGTNNFSSGSILYQDPIDSQYLGFTY